MAEPHSFADRACSLRRACRCRCRATAHWRRDDCDRAAAHRFRHADSTRAVARRISRASAAQARRRSCDQDGRTGCRRDGVRIRIRDGATVRLDGTVRQCVRHRARCVSSRTDDIRVDTRRLGRCNGCGECNLCCDYRHLDRIGGDLFQDRCAGDGAAGLHREVCSRTDGRLVRARYADTA